MNEKDITRIVTEAVKEVLGGRNDEYALFDLPETGQASKALDDCINDFLVQLRQVQKEFGFAGAWDTESNEAIAAVVHDRILGRD